MEKLKIIKVDKIVHKSLKYRALKNDTTMIEEVNEILTTKLKEDGDLIESE